VDVLGRLMARSDHVVHADDRLVHHTLGAVSDVLGAAGQLVEKVVDFIRASQPACNPGH